MENRGRVILFVEDNPGDARLLLEMLKEIPMNSYKAIVAGSMSEAISNLNEHKFDIVILDLNLPDSKGLGTLYKIISKTGGSVPVIVMTGLNDENTGISAIESGAEDYLVKGDVNSTQLLRSIRYSIERNKFARELRRSEEQSRAIMNNLPGGIIHILDRDFRYLYNAGEALAAVGLTNEMLVGKTIYDLLTPELAEIAAESYRLVLAGETVRFEGEFADKIFMVIATPLYGGDGSVENILILSIDITDRKKAEETLQKQFNELKKWQSVTLGREGRIIELKKEINELLLASGKEQKYGF